MDGAGADSELDGAAEPELEEDPEVDGAAEPEVEAGDPAVSVITVTDPLAGVLEDSVAWLPEGVAGTATTDELIWLETEVG